MPKNMQGSRVTSGVVPNYKSNSVKKPATGSASAKDIRRPGQPGGKGK
jgi:hypothetical protein